MFLTLTSKNPSLDAMLNFDADVKKMTRLTNVKTVLSRSASAGRLAIHRGRCVGSGSMGGRDVTEHTRTQPPQRFAPVSNPHQRGPLSQISSLCAGRTQCKSGVPEALRIGGHGRWRWDGEISFSPNSGGGGGGPFTVSLPFVHTERTTHNAHRALAHGWGWGPLNIIVVHSTK